VHSVTRVSLQELCFSVDVRGRRRLRICVNWVYSVLYYIVKV